MPLALAALICGCRPAGSLPASSTIALAFCATAAFMPCTHCEGWPWFCQIVVLTPASPATRFMWFAIVETNGIWLDAGMTKIVLPPDFAFASKPGPGATNFGTARYLSRFAFAPSQLAVVAAV